MGKFRAAIRFAAVFGVESSRSRLVLFFSLHLPSTASPYRAQSSHQNLHKFTRRPATRRIGDLGPFLCARLLRATKQPSSPAGSEGGGRPAHSVRRPGYPVSARSRLAQFPRPCGASGRRIGFRSRRRAWRRSGRTYAPQPKAPDRPTRTARERRGATAAICREFSASCGAPNSA